MITAYTSQTGTITTLQELQKKDWRLLLTPQTLAAHGWRRPKWRDGSLAKYCLDNGAFGYYTAAQPFNIAAFERALNVVGSKADWIVVPDIVAGGLKSLEFSLSWLPRLKSFGPPLLLAVQDGMEAKDVAPHLNENIGIFIGGTTEWKLESGPMWGRVSKQRNCKLHVARVNSARRIKFCQTIGAHSFDGSSPVRFPCTLPRLDRARRQLCLW